VIAIAVEGESPREAAARLGTGYDAVRKRYQRALLRLRQDFSQ
jgi:RNA polymerase sigma-70 factor (ECF subfamily)